MRAHVNYGGGARNKYKNLKGNPRGERAYFFALLGLHEKNPLTHTGDMYIKRPCCMLVVCFSAFEVRRFGVDVFHWTPVFALGKIYVYVCDAEAAARDPTLPTRLNESSELGKFIKNVLPDILTHMSDAHGCGRTPRTIVHDKASYMVAPRSQRLEGPFADALRAAKMKSWVGDADANCSWLAGRLGDLYPHETAISHIRTGLSHRFPRSTPGETRARFANRMEKVVGYMNSKEFTARDGGGLMALSQSLRDRFSRMKELKGERLRT